MKERPAGLSDYHANDGRKSASNPRSPLRAACLLGFAPDGWCQLRRLLVSIGSLSLLFSSLAMAANPQDLAFQLRLVKETPVYHPGSRFC